MRKRDRDTTAGAGEAPAEEPVAEGEIVDDDTVADDTLADAEVVDVTEGVAGDQPPAPAAPDAGAAGGPSEQHASASAASAGAGDGDGDGGDGDGDGDGSVADAAEAVEADLAVLARERDDYLDALRRLQADFENFKKRSIRQQTEALDRAAEGLVQKLLPVLDAIDLARQHGAGDGVEPIANALTDVLAKEGLERVGEPGDPFDPNLHEAVAHEEGDGGEATLAEVMRAGWSWKGRLLRAAMVKVRG